MSSDGCRNQNHSKMNVAVRYCSGCGNIVNKNIPEKKCSTESHARRRKDRNQFCTDCGKNLAS